MDWKTRARLEEMEKSIEENEDMEIVNLRDVDEVPADAQPITFDDLMKLMKDPVGRSDGRGGEEASKSAAKRESIQQWNDARKKVDVNALFRPN